MVTQLMGADLNGILKCQQLSDDHVKFLIYQILRGLKVGAVISQKLTLIYGNVYRDFLHLPFIFQYIHSAGVIHRVRICIMHN